MDRMTEGNRRDLIEQFLWGQLAADEAADFAARLDCDAALRQRLEEESGFEALFYDMSWDVQDAPGFDSETSLAEVVAPMPALENDDESSLFSAAEWQELIDTAFAEAAESEAPKTVLARTLAFPRMVRYLAAACLVGLIGAGIALWILPPKTPHIASHGAVPALAEATPGNQASEIASRKEAKRASLVFDSLVIYRSIAAAGTPISTESKGGIVQLGEKTAILLEKNSSAAVTARSDSAVTISLSQGSALFTVEKHRYSRFSVATPGGDIAVTGTVFRLSVQDDTTIVSVLEGSVKARKKADSVFVAIPAGMSARIRPDTIMLEYGDTAATLLSRSNLLRDFLKENSVFDDGRFVPSGMTTNADAALKREGEFGRENDGGSQK